MDMGLAQYREHMTPTMRMHRVITEGGDQPNVIPRTAAVWWYFRDFTAEGAGKLFEQAKKIAQGAALMTNTRVEIDVMSAVWPVRGNRTLAELVAARNRGRRPAELDRGGGRARAAPCRRKSTCRSTASSAEIRADEGAGGAEGRRQ